MIGKPTAPSLLDKQVNRLLRELDGQEITSEEYETTLSRLKTLHGLMEAEKPSPVSRDTVLMVAANLLGILLIISTEREHVITTKALTMLARPSKS